MEDKVAMPMNGGDMESLVSVLEEEVIQSLLFNEVR